MICEVTVHIADQFGVDRVPLYVTEPVPAIDAIREALQRVGKYHGGCVIVVNETTPYQRLGPDRFEVAEWSLETPNRDHVICAGRVTVGSSSTHRRSPQYGLRAA